MVAITHLEREVRRGNRGEALLCEFPLDEKLARVAVEVDALAAQETVVEKGRHDQLVGLAQERVEILLEARPGGPAAERNADLVRGVAARHPVALLGADELEELLQRRRRALAHADDADVGRFDQRDVDVLVAPVQGKQVGGDPAGGAAAENDNALHADALANVSRLASLSKKNRPTSRAHRAVFLGCRLA